MPTVTYRDLTTLDEFAQVVDLEREIWGPGYNDVVPTPILTISVKRGGILIGAFGDEAASDDGRGRLIGFVYSLPGIKDGKPTQWSHMLGVIDQFRADGVGSRLKLLQRDRALAMGVELIEWTFDPLQAMNAHLNFAKLGVVAEEYEENIYGSSASPLHKGNPTDRLVAEWWLRRERQRHDWSGAQPFSPAAVAATAPKLTIDIPTGFTRMLSMAPDAALEWRMKTRSMFASAFAARYVAVDFLLDRSAGKGSYLLTRR
ncbi:MAG TPA: hypothetical protein VIW45_16715 [Vicinamibacterales bacterium]|jgi:predicted GNAT superfamily acetyltransferase